MAELVYENKRLQSTLERVQKQAEEDVKKAEYVSAYTKAAEAQAVADAAEAATKEKKGEPGPAEKASKPPEVAPTSQQRQGAPQEEPGNPLLPKAKSVWTPTPGANVSVHARALENLPQEAAAGVRKLMD